MTREKRNLEFDIERHRMVKHHLKVARGLRTLELMGLVKSRKHPVTGQIQFRITEKGLRERKTVLN
jgi:DNA-binding PadR family transcriptional regulator